MSGWEPVAVICQIGARGADWPTVKAAEPSSVGVRGVGGEEGCGSLRICSIQERRGVNLIY